MRFQDRVDTVFAPFRSRAVCLSQLPRMAIPVHGDTWGAWKLDAEVLVLRHKSGYEVDLENMTGAANMLDAIMQVEGHGYDAGELVAALCDILNPQSYLCSGCMASRKGSGGKTVEGVDRYLRIEREESC